MRILVVDDRADVAQPLLDHLSARGHLAAYQASARGALTAITNKRTAGNPFDLVIASFALTDGAGLALAKALRDEKESLAIALYAPFGNLARGDFDEAQRLDCRFLDMPIAMSRVDQLLGEAAAHGKGPGGGSRPPKDQPFFGTGRIVRHGGSTAATEGETSRALKRLPDSSAPGTQPTTTSTFARPDSKPTIPPATISQPGTGSKRWTPPGGSPTLTPTQGTGRHSNQLSTTARIRRGVTGRLVNNDLQRLTDRTEKPHQVTCAACSKEFAVERRAQAFTSICVHCGQLNRIEPG